MDENKIQEDLVEIKIQLKEISTLLTERKETIQKHTHDIGDAFRDIRELRADLTKNNENTHRVSDHQDLLEGRLTTLEKAVAVLTQTVHDHEKTLIKVSLISTLATAVLTGVIMKFFVG
jgi:chromosome segregation ATPase